jgi:hypothetical protein
VSAVERLITDQPLDPAAFVRYAVGARDSQNREAVGPAG